MYACIVRGVLTKLAALLAPVASRVAPATLSLGALGCGVAAAWTQGTFWGLLGTGGALLLAEWRMVEPKPGEQR
jgi:hypothetical protein